MVNQFAYSMEDDQNVFEQYYDEPDTVAYGDCCEEAKDKFMEVVKEEMQRGVSLKDGEMIIQALNVYKIPCKDFAELLEKLSSMTGGRDAVVQVNNISSRYFRIDKLPTRMLSGIANLIKRAAVEASTTYRNCRAMKKSWDILRRE
jgi:hypothetical protein